MQTNQVQDDLTKIPGLGEACQQWLADVLGVQTYNKLAALSFEEIEPIKAQIKSVDLKKVKNWPKEAKKLAAEQATRSNPAAVDNLKSQVGITSVRENDKEESVGPKTQDRPWKSDGMFLVEFQTRSQEDQAIEFRTKVKYLETEQKEFWPGIEVKQIGQWMIEQAGLKLDQGSQGTLVVETESVPVNDAESPERTVLALTDLRFYQPPDVEISLASEKDGKLYAAVIKADRSFDIVSKLNVDSQKVETIGKHEIAYQVQFFAQNHDTREKVHLGNTNPDLLSDGKTHYSARLTGITLRSGTYRLQAVVFAEATNVAPGYLELPRLHVV
jgi:predicted flap endonuclease-1-like 5' DNA nuclease